MSGQRVKQAGGLDPAVAVKLADLVAYAEGAIVSRTLVQATTGTMTLFSFDAGQALSEHTSPFDAFVQVLDGEALLTIGGKPVPTRAGELTRMPAGVPHAVDAPARMKMLLTLIRPEPARPPA